MAMNMTIPQSNASTARTCTCSLNTLYMLVQEDPSGFLQNILALELSVALFDFTGNGNVCMRAKQSSVKHIT